MPKNATAGMYALVTGDSMLEFTFGIDLRLALSKYYI